MGSRILIGGRFNLRHMGVKWHCLVGYMALEFKRGLGKLLMLSEDWVLVFNSPSCFAFCEHAYKCSQKYMLFFFNQLKSSYI